MSRAENRESRRHDIVEALLRVMGARGLHAVTMRAVALEAGVSLHLVQHYFETKEQLMHFALQRLAEQMAERLKTKLIDARRPREVVEVVLAEAVPTDERSRIFHLAYTSYAILAVTDEALAAHPFLAAPDAMETFVAGQLAQARADGDLAAGLDPRAEAVVLLAMAAGLGIAVLAGQRSAESALAVLHGWLARIIPAPGDSGEAQ
ncbi:TetR family transcriptional regulator [Nonomuraea sp. NN258]|uniref:TetR/AcrR family transcriptional regulator n=1 Tax=Nonomuraea antri TaxID=2730852 RepID=UPI001568F0FE|nr:TetR/AcrR family transcriptional regulator [Nonomuraea antri]NRQ34004.1 TetR family transcriptional regulator [Nonomuraea antri]